VDRAGRDQQLRADLRAVNLTSDLELHLTLQHGHQLVRRMAKVFMDFFMDFFAEGLGNRGFRAARFEYPYTASKRVAGKQKPPDREAVLRQPGLDATHWRAEF
jgi:predicted alpha/beta-hydrolase family hydrolase